MSCGAGSAASARLAGGRHGPAPHADSWQKTLRLSGRRGAGAGRVGREWGRSRDRAVVRKKGWSAVRGAPRFGRRKRKGPVSSWRALQDQQVGTEANREVSRLCSVQTTGSEMPPAEAPLDPQ